MPIKPTSVRFPVQLFNKLQKLVEEGKYASINVAVIKLLEEALARRNEKGQEKPSTLGLMLKAVLGDDLSKRHIEFLEKRRKQDQMLEDVFRNFLYDKGIDFTTKESIDRIHAEKIDHFYVGKPEPCEFRVIDPEKKKWYCDGKLIPSVVCVAKQQRRLAKGYGCHPSL